MPGRESIASGGVPDWLPSRIAELLPGASGADCEVVAIPGGGNNRVFRASTGGRPLFVKWYFTSAEDPRDRLRTEWEFARFAWSAGLRSLAEPLACDRDRQLAVFEFIAGRRLQTGEVSEPHVDSAVAFLSELNRHRADSEAVQLAAASEACFSLSEHVACVRRRVDLLQAAVRSGELSTAANAFLRDRLLPAAERAETRVLDHLLEPGCGGTARLLMPERILSPSDFGFHNALLEPGGRLRFFDFEYAGWDDPAKTVCDFFSQVAVPVPDCHWTRFVSALAQLSGPGLAQRAERLRPLYSVKWCCIVLNPLLRPGRQRRRFSSGADAGISDADCLARAETILSRIEV